jgi:hypothetical protein
MAPHPFTVTRLGTAAVLCVATSALAEGVVAQDAHYWTEQFGTRGDLLGGLVVGAVEDPSATFYNPGALGLLDQPAFLITANGFQHTWITLDGLGTEPDLRSRRLDVSPDFIGGSLPLDWFGKSRLSYSAFTRSRLRARLAGRRVDSREFVDANPDSLGLVQEAVLDHRMTETWVGLSWAYPVASNVGVGVTQFLSVRSQGTELNRVLEAFAQSPEIQGGFQSRDFGYTTWRLLWKAGVKLQAGRWRVGGALTTPALRLFGSGESASNETIFDQSQGEAELEPRLAASDQKDLRASWKTPWSVSAGVSYQLNRGAVHATAEWFGAVGSYEVVETKPFRSQTQGDTVRIEWLGELRSVLNTGAGAEYLFSDAVTGYGSFRTDFSAAPSGDRLTVSAATWDLYHLTFGAGLHFRSFDLTIGTALAYGQDTVPHEGMDPEEGPVIPPLPDGRITYFRAKLLLGFQLFIGGRVVGMGGATSGSL